MNKNKVHPDNARTHPESLKIRHNTSQVHFATLFFNINMTKITFQISSQTNFGETVALVGNVPALGTYLLFSNRWNRKNESTRIRHPPSIFRGFSEHLPQTKCGLNSIKLSLLCRWLEGFKCLNTKYNSW